MTNFLGSLDRRDRRLLFLAAAIGLTLIVLVAVLSPADQDTDPTPASDSLGTHGAKAAYLLLERSGYKIQRNDDPLAELAKAPSEHTTLILAQPNWAGLKQSQPAIRQFLEHGGTVLATGMSASFLLPNAEAEINTLNPTTQCQATPTGFGPLASSGDIRLHPAAYWTKIAPDVSIDYTCDGKPVVVHYSVGKGSVIWWASSYPLENIGIQHADNIALLLRSVGDPKTTAIIWDESLHGALPDLWSYAKNTPIHWLQAQLAFIALLFVLSFARRGGPLRPDPLVSRAASLEFVNSLGSLYEKAAAASVPVAVARQRFLFQLEKRYGIERATTASAAQVAHAVASRYQIVPAPLLRDLQAAQQAAKTGKISPAAALALVQSLHDHEHLLSARSQTTLQPEENRLGRTRPAA